MESVVRYIIEKDDIVIAENNRTNPSGANLSDGSITLTVSPGGKETYYYKGEAITKGKTIGLTDLPWGETEVEFTDKEGNVIYTYKVSLLPNVKFNTKSQTCVHANGAISPSGDDVGKCTQWHTGNGKSNFCVKIRRYLGVSKVSAEVFKYCNGGN